ncbi:MAG: hypothetical protein Q7S76_03165 [bacterium]|nr:hypothetical protein [bacterium]
MTANAKIIIVLFVASVLGVSLWFNRDPRTSVPLQSSQQTLPLETKEQSAANVTIIVTPRALSPGNPAQFEITFETHSVDLAFDVSETTTLTDDLGNTYGQPVWDGSPPGGHHRTGIIAFNRPLDSRAHDIFLTFRNIADTQERTFTWELKNP